MEVDVVRMRLRGEKLSKEQLRLARPIRGTLTVSSRLEGNGGKSVLIAVLAGGPRFELLAPALDFAQLGPLRGDCFVLKGIEEVGDRKHFDKHPQSWWCKLVLPERAARDAFGYDHESELMAAGVMLDAPQWRP